MGGVARGVCTQFTLVSFHFAMTSGFRIKMHPHKLIAYGAFLNFVLFLLMVFSIVFKYIASIWLENIQIIESGIELIR